MEFISGINFQKKLVKIKSKIILTYLRQNETFSMIFKHCGKMQLLGDFWYKKLSFKNGISVIFFKVFEAKINDVCLFKSLKPHFRQQEFFERSKKDEKRKLTLQIPFSHSLEYN